MKLYHKQLKSVAHLRKEKKRLKVDSKVAVNNAGALDDAKSADNPLASFSTILNELLSSKGTTGVLLSAAMPLFGPVLKKSGKGMLKAAKEVLGGYIKWKAIDMGVKMAIRFIRAQKHKAGKHG